MLPALAHQVHVTAVDMSPVMVAAGAGGIAGAALCPLLPLVRLCRLSVVPSSPTCHAATGARCDSGRENGRAAHRRSVRCVQRSTACCSAHSIAKKRKIDDASRACLFIAPW
jgi:hypothetical protein